VVIPTVATATSLLSSQIGRLIAQFETGSNDSQYLFSLADLREFSSSGVLHHWLLLQYLYPLLLFTLSWCISISASQIPAVGLQDGHLVGS
jgi:hypothetical protein